MRQSQVWLKLDEPGRVYAPGEVLSGTYCLQDVPADEIRSVELSVLWHTEGKGDEDMSVHFFERAQADPAAPWDLREPRPFRSALPNSPLSYRGLIVKICWRVRIRVFMTRGKELLLEAPFQLGMVPEAQEVAP